MKKTVKRLLFVFCLCLFSSYQAVAQNDKANDTRMNWWKEAKFGMFIHWGLYSIPAGTWEGRQMNKAFGSEWILNVLRIPVSKYRTLAPRFNPQKFNPDSIVLLAKEAGMKYIVLTAKHCDGFAMFKSANPFNIVDATPYRRDVVQELSEACKKHHMPFGLYYSQAQDWYHPGGGAYEKKWDPAQEGNFNDFIEQVSLPQVKEIVSTYHPRLLWFDTPAEMTPELARKFEEYLTNYPDLIYNDRLGGGVEGDWSTPEQFIPESGIPGRNWESCMTMNGTWGYNADDHTWKSTEALIRNLIDIASKGGNYLLNVGPDATGMIPAPSAQRLREMGKWLKVNGTAVYGVSSSPFVGIQWGRATQKSIGNKTTLYLHIFDFPSDKKLRLYGLKNQVLRAYALAQPNRKLVFSKADAELVLDLTQVEKTEYATVVVLEMTGKPQVVNPPEIMTTSDVFIEEMPVNMVASGEIRYTLDGRNPDSTSPISNGKMIFHEKSDFVLKAQVFQKGKPSSGISERTFRKVLPMAPVFEGKPGLQYAYYEGIWTTLPDFSVLKPVKTGTANTLNLEVRNRDKQFGVVFQGYIRLNNTTVYSLYLSSDDGSRLEIDGTTVLDFDGVHGMEERKVDLPLASGLHSVKLLYFQGDGGLGLNLDFQPLGGSRSKLESSFLMH